MPERTDPLAPPAGYGEPDPHAKAAEDTRCDVYESHPLIAADVLGTRCTRQGVLRIWFGCDREHLGFVDLCPFHKYLTSNIMCGRCQQAGNPQTVKIIKREEHDA